MSLDLIGKISRQIFPVVYREFRDWHRSRLGTEAPLVPLVVSRLRRLLGRPHTGQIVSKELKHPVTIRLWTSDEYVFDQIFREREYDIEIPAPQTIIDAGANIGLSAVYFANRFPDAKIFAIEPEPHNFDFLQQNSSPYDQIHPIKIALWHKPARVQLIDGEVDPWAFRFEETKSETGYVATSIDEIMSDQRLPKIDLLKLDIEGAEKNIFDNPGDWIHRVNTIVVECHDRMIEGCTTAVYKVAEQYQFDTSTCGENIILQSRTND